MTDQPYMALWVADFVGDTTHLSDAEVGQYLLLLMAMWRCGGTLPNDPARLARVARTDRVSDAVMALLTIGDGTVTQKRLQKELAYTRERSAKQSANAKARWLKDNDSGNATAYATALPPHMPNGCPHTHTHTHIEKKKEGGAKAPSRLDEGFESFWKLYPHKVGKAAAWKAFKTVENRASLEQILDGLQRYIASKPPDRPWCNPATFLNQDRWLDEPAVVTFSGVRKNGTGWYIKPDSREWDAWKLYGIKHSVGDIIYGMKVAEEKGVEFHVKDRWPPR